MNFNGLSLQTEFSTLLGDTSTAFKAKVLQYMNDIQNDICSRHDWPFLKVKGKKVLTASSEIQSLLLSKPTAPTIAKAGGGSLTASSTYSVLVTFYESVADIESVLGLASNSVSTDVSNKTLDLTNIPISPEPLVTARKIYLSKDSGAYYYHSTINDNVSTSTSISSDTTSTITAPDYQYLRNLESNPFFEGNNSGYLELMQAPQMRLLFQGSWSTGVPEFFAQGGGDYNIIVYPLPSSALTLSFYYYKMPKQLVAEVDSYPIIPIYLKPVLKAGVIALGYEYRDRSGQEVKMQIYESLLAKAISENGKTIKSSGKVRDVNGDSRGIVIY